MACAFTALRRSWKSSASPRSAACFNALRALCRASRAPSASTPAACSGSPGSTSASILPSPARHDAAAPSAKASSAPSSCSSRLAPRLQRRPHRREGIGRRVFGKAAQPGGRSSRSAPRPRAARQGSPRCRGSAHSPRGEVRVAGAHQAQQRAQPLHPLAAAMHGLVRPLRRRSKVPQHGLRSRPWRCAAPRPSGAGAGRCESSFGRLR